MEFLSVFLPAKVTDMDSEKSPKWLIYVAIGVNLAFALAVFLGSNNWRFGFLFAISGAFGFILKYGGFGFTCTFRSMVTNGDFSQFRDMLLMLFVGNGLCALVSHISGLHPLFDPSHSGTFGDSAAPIGVSLVLGAFFFGMGMQLGNGCASGTFVGIGEGFLKAYVVLPFFIMGATVGATDPFYKWWSNLPKTNGPVQIEFGFVLLILIAIYFLTFVFDFIRIRKQSNDHELYDEFNGMRRLFSIEANQDAGSKGSGKKWYKNVLVDCLLGLILALFYLCDGGMIGVMGVFPKIGMTVLRWCGVKVENWAYFKAFGGLPNNYLNLEIFDSDIFMACGAFLASAIAGNFGKSQKNSIVEYTKGIFGGLLMGLGARMANGCNIGSMTSGITSSSMHGFVWMLMAILGSLLVCQTTRFIEARCKKPEGLNTYTPVQ